MTLERYQIDSNGDLWNAAAEIITNGGGVSRGVDKCGYEMVELDARAVSITRYSRPDGMGHFELVFDYENAPGPGAAPRDTVQEELDGIAAEMENAVDAAKQAGFRSMYILEAGCGGREIDNATAAGAIMESVRNAVLKFEAAGANGEGELETALQHAFSDFDG